jgi:hypothetical protein
MQATRTWTPRAAYFWRRAAKPAAICSRSRASCADRSGSSASGSIPPPPDTATQQHSKGSEAARAHHPPPAGGVHPRRAGGELSIFQFVDAVRRSTVNSLIYQLSFRRFTHQSSLN